MGPLAGSLGPLGVSLALAAGGGGFVPTDLGSKLLRWYRAKAGVYVDTGSTLAVNNDTANQWNDYSGNTSNIVQATSANRPTFTTGVLNSNPVLRFDGVNDTMLASIPSAAIQSAYIVARKRSATGGNVGLLTWGAPTTIFCNGSFGSAWQWYSCSGGSSSGGVDSFGGDVQNWSTIAVVFGASSAMDMYRNGLLIDSVTASSSSPTSLEIAAYVGNAADVDVAEIVLTNGTETPTEMTSIFNYLRTEHAHY